MLFLLSFAAKREFSKGPIMKNNTYRTVAALATACMTFAAFATTIKWKADDSGSSPDDANTIKTIINTLLEIIKKVIEFFKSIFISK